MMVHPWPSDRLEATASPSTTSTSTSRGREAHASAAPWEGVNAARRADDRPGGDRPAAPAAAPGDQVHGIVIDGGVAANIIPAPRHRAVHVPLVDADRLAVLRARVDACFEAGRARRPAPPRARRARPPVLAHGLRPGAAAPLPPPRRGARRDFTDDDAGAAAAHAVDRHGQRLAASSRRSTRSSGSTPRRGQPPARVRRGVRDARAPTARSSTARIALAATGVAWPRRRAARATNEPS